MAKKYTGTLSLEWFNKDKSVITDSNANGGIPAPKINWINKDEALFYEISEKDGKGKVPYWVNRNDIRVKESRPLILKKVYKAISKKDNSGLVGADNGFEVAESDVDDLTTTNMLVKGDNLLALNTLKKIFDKKPDEEKVKCIYIDPPYNTGSAFEHYDDNIAHSEWLTLMRDRLVLLKDLLREDGVIWITVDDSESHYLKVLCDEVFGRNNFIANVIWRISDNSNNNTTTFSEDHNHILVYSKSEDWAPKFLNDESKRSHFKNPDNDPKGPWFDGNPVNNPGLRPNLQFNITAPNGNIIKHPPNGWRWSKSKIEEKLKTGELRFSEDQKRLIRRTYLKDMEGLPPSTLWDILQETGHNRQAKYELKKLFPETAVTSLFSTPKPEKLIKKVIELSTDEDDIVLDCFGGSGTTFAVAHKMNRRWIGVELGDHADTHILSRLKLVLNGEDSVGITKEVNWKGGGSFKYYHLGESIIKYDESGRGDFNWSLGEIFIQESLIQSYDYILDEKIRIGSAGIEINEHNYSVGYKNSGNSVNSLVITLCSPDEGNDTISLEEIKHIYNIVKKTHNSQNVTIFTNRGVEIAYEDKPEDLEIVKIPHAIFAELER